MRIGIFDSGIGGLTVLSSIKKRFQSSEIFYVADSFYAPYGQKKVEQIKKRCERITEFLISNHNIEALIVACNSATSVAIESLRKNHQNLIVIGVEPALKPAILNTKTKKIGVMATQTTLQGQKYKKLVDELVPSSGIVLYEEPCIGLVEQIESGQIASKKTVQMLESWLVPFKENGVDTIVLGCTHFPIVKKSIQAIMGESVKLIESSEAIANRLDVLSKEKEFSKNSKQATNSKLIIYYTGEISESLVQEILESKNIEARKCEI